MKTIELSPQSVAPALILAFCASLLELGPIISQLHTSESLVEVLLLGLAYQLGNGLSRLVPNSTRLIVLLSGGGFICFTLATNAAPILFVAVLSLSLALQLSRRIIQRDPKAASPGTAAKRSARVVGFVAAAALPVMASVTIVLIACALILLKDEGTSEIQDIRSAPRNADRWNLHYLHVVMLFHQMHYFAYCYVIPYILKTHSKYSNASIGFGFALGWITYLSAERLFSKYPEQRVFLCGHVFVAFCLVGLAFFSDSFFSAAALWILTGLGGGSVYCITRLHHDLGLQEKHLSGWEDIGHVGGVLLSLAIGSLYGFSPPTFFWTGALLAISTVFTFVVVRGKVMATNHDSISRKR